MAGKSGHRSFGHVRRLPSRRWQASYVGPDLARHVAPSTFDAKDDAVSWLVAERKLVESGGWASPQERERRQAAQTMTLSEYATTWLSERSLRPRTRMHYQRLLDRFIVSSLGDIPVGSLHPAQVRQWYAALESSKPTQRAHAYALLKAVCKTAVDDDLLTANPCRIRGAGQVKRASQTTPATVEELAAIVNALPRRYRAMALLASWCALRLGELCELRRSDLDLASGVVHVRRALTWVDGEAVVGPPKSDAGVRTVAIPPHVIPAIRAHLKDMPVTGRDALLFPAAGDPTKHLRPASLYKVYYAARAKAGRPDLRWHDLRHTGAVFAALTGASLVEVMSRLGHSTPAAAMRYQHVARGRDAQVAARLSELVEGLS